MTSEIKVRENGCIKADCIVELPCPNKHPPKTEDGFCTYYDNGKVKAAIEQKTKSIGGKQT